MSQTNPPPGWSPWKKFTFVQWIVIAVAIATIVLSVGWLKGHFLRQPKIIAIEKPEPSPTASRSFVTLGGYNQKVYFFASEEKVIYELTPQTNTIEKLADASVSVTSVVASPDQKKVAILSIGTAHNKGIYIFDAVAPKSPLQEVLRSEFLPPGYSLQSDSTMIWSPLSTHIALIAYKENTPDIFVAPVSVQGRIQHLRSPGDKLGKIVWLDEQTITFEAQLYGKDLMYRVNSDGGDLQIVKR